MIYLTVDDVVGLHDIVMEYMGAPPCPLLHPLLLESAIDRARNLASYHGVDIFSQASCLAVAISQAQAFLDGNKRAAYSAMVTFLDVNGVVYGGCPLELSAHLEAVAESPSGPKRDEKIFLVEKTIRKNAVYRMQTAREFPLS